MLAIDCIVCSLIFSFNRQKMMEQKKSYWNKWYVAVIVFLLFQIAVYNFITQFFK